MNIVFFSDKNYEYQIKSLIKSLDLRRIQGMRLIYYTIGFDSEMDRSDLIKKRIEFDINKKRFEFYKPGIILDVSKNFEGHSIFLDSDIIVGRRFDLNLLRNDTEIPMLSIGNWDGPLSYQYRDVNSGFPVFKIGERISLKNYEEIGWVSSMNHQDQTFTLINDEGIEITEKQVNLESMVIYDHNHLMRYLGVTKIPMTYVSTCFVSFNDKCQDILLEWKSMVENEYLLQKPHEYFAFHDETALNVILWKRGVSVNYGRIFLNTLYSEAAVTVDSDNEIYDSHIQNNPNQFCKRSSDVMFYHGMKDQNEIDNMINYLEKI
jgi:hypothetical protein